MNKPNHALTKTCINCGLQKPLSAFLQFGTQGATYGNICASCRKMHQDKVNKKESDETTRREASGSKIRASERLAGEVDKKQHRERLERLNAEEQKKDEKQQLDNIQKTETRIKSEKTHRETLEKRSFLDSTDKAKRTASAEQIFGSEAHKAKEGEVRLDVPVVGPLDREKYKSVRFREFINWLGSSSAPIVSASERAAKAAKNAPDTHEKETLSDIAKKNWGPGQKS